MMVFHWSFTNAYDRFRPRIIQGRDEVDYLAVNVECEFR